MQKGLTLIELMIVITVIGILSAIAVPAYQNYIARSQISEALILSSRFKMEISSIYSDKATCPTLAELGVPTGILHGKYVASIAVTPKANSLCNIQFTFKNTAINNNISGKHLNLSMITYTNSNGASEWSCTSSDIEQHLMPTSCKKI